MRFSLFSLFAYASGFSADTFTNFNNPDAMIEMMKTMVIPMMKNAYDQLDHEKMHEEMMEDNIQMRFVDRGFDFCVGEEAQEMSYEDDLKCSKRIFEMIIDYVPEEIPTENFIQEQDQELIYQLNGLFDLDQNGHFSRSEIKNVFYCYLRIAFQKLNSFGIYHNDLASQISSLATTIPEIMNSDDAETYFEGHRRLYQILQTRFNEVRLGNLLKNVEPTPRGVTKLAAKLLDEFSDFAAEVYTHY